LTGAIFDPWVRFIVKEGIRGWWREESLLWAACPEDGDPFPRNSTGGFVAAFKNAVEVVVASMPYALQRAVISTGLVTPPGFTTALESGDRFLPVCPFTWSKPIHELNCKYVWPPHLETGHWPLVELDTPEYWGKLKQDKVVEKLLAMGGIRLAAVLNSIFLGKVGDGDKMIAAGPWMG
jgi:hypothetical protein